ncbi:hypothetical protein MUK42_17152 [Musa troglodytarum]|uniref:Uncharacterized protein n=1 Tax=Musa troglodytarum TaxID=320322 RepID=A0A9E7HBH1_9LILI|nr:hypothetical protein MUK42_17152 [Musa troglodytarum]
MAHKSRAITKHYRQEKHFNLPLKWRLLPFDKLEILEKSPCKEGFVVARGLEQWGLFLGVQFAIFRGSPLVCVFVVLGVAWSPSGLAKSASIMNARLGFFEDSCLTLETLTWILGRLPRLDYKLHPSGVLVDLDLCCCGWRMRNGLASDLVPLLSSSTKVSNAIERHGFGGLLADHTVSFSAQPASRH